MPRNVLFPWASIEMRSEVLAEFCSEDPSKPPIRMSLLFLADKVASTRSSVLIIFNANNSSSSLLVYEIPIAAFPAMVVVREAMFAFAVDRSMLLAFNASCALLSDLLKTSAVNRRVLPSFYSIRIKGPATLILRITEPRMRFTTVWSSHASPLMYEVTPPPFPMEAIEARMVFIEACRVAIALLRLELNAYGCKLVARCDGLILSSNSAQNWSSVCSNKIKELLRT